MSYLNMNRATIIGRLGQDPQVRKTNNNNAVASLSVATNHSYLPQGSNEWVNETDWHRVVVWGKKAEWCAQNLGKGDVVLIEGRLVTRDYTDKDGVKRYTTEIVADKVQSPVGMKGAGGGGGGGGAGTSRGSGSSGGEFTSGGYQSSQPSGKASGNGGLSDDDIPF